MEKIMFEEIKDYRQSYLTDINHLLTQLSGSHSTMEEEGLREIISSPNSHLYALLCEGRITGMITLCTYRCPTGRKAWIEDILVDSSLRGRGLGKMMVEKVTAIARQQGSTTLMLTSRPSRIAANRLYQSLGFEKRETNVYRMTL